jgi:cytochrome c-type biogenesis protein CcmH/NrfF
MQEGQTDRQIEQFLITRYGQGIMLRPPTRGIAGLVWLLPLVVGGLAAAAVGAFFWRRRRIEPVTVDEADVDLVKSAMQDRVNGTALR